MALFARKSRIAPSESAPKELAPAPADDSVAAPGDDSQRQIAIAAYYRWLERGGVEGDEQQDWYAAEREIAGKDKQERPLR
jgi:hypothetical protein